MRRNRPDRYKPIPFKTTDAFTLLEAVIAIILVGIMGTIGFYYLDSTGMTKSQYKASLQSQFNLVESMAFQCKNLSEQMPQQIGGANAADTNLTLLECNTTTPYRLNGGHNGFVPVPPQGFTPYTATESGSIFFIKITADNNTTQDEALKSLIKGYTSQQASLEHNATSAIFKFYLSR